MKIKRNLIHTLFYILFSLISFHSFSQEQGIPIIRNYTPKEYNGAPQVWAALQDSRGIMYFGASDGVIEYDGILWKSIPTENKSTAKDLAMDSKGKIYVAATDEFGYLTTDYKGNTIYKSLLYLIKDTTLKLGAVRSVKITSTSVYFRTIDAILQYLPASEQINIFKAETGGRFNRGFIYKDVYYTRLSEKGLMKIENNQLFPAIQSEFFKNKNYFRVAVPYNSNTFLIPTPTEGIYLYKPDEETIPQAFTISNKDFITDNDIYNATVFQKDYFVFGSLQKGALLIDKTGNTIQEYNEQNLLQVNKIYKITNDTTQNLWFGLGNGISKTEHSMDLSYWDKNAGLKGTVTNVIRYKDIMYIATSSAIYYIDKKNQIKEVKSIPAGQNWCFFQDNNINSLLAGTSQGIFEIKENNAVQIYKGSHAFKIYQSLKNPNRIMSTNGYSLISLLFENGIWISEGKWEGINENIRGIIEGNTGDLWLGTRNSGVIRITPDYDNITKSKKIRYYNEEDGFVSLQEIYPFTFKNKIIWGTETGLYIYNVQTDKFEPFCELGEQFCNSSCGVYSLIEMPDGKVWISPLENKNADIGYLQPNSKDNYDWIYTPFRRIPEMSIQSFYIEPSGIPWIGGNEGLYRYDMSKDSKNYKQSFNCLIRKVTVGADSLLYGGNTPDTTLSGFLTLTELKYEFNSIKFEFAAPFFDHEEKTLYSYKLEGFDKEWSKYSREPKKEYTNLSEGIYTFQVKARNIYDLESEIASHEFTILPPWQRTWWAYIIYVILSFLFIYIIVKLNSRRLKVANIQLEKIVAMRTHKINEQKDEIESQNEHLEKVNEKLEKLSVVASETDNAVVIMDPEGNFEWINEGFTRLFGYNIEQLIDEIGWNIKSTSVNPEIIKIIDTCISEKQSVSYQSQMLSRAGRKIWCQTTINPITDEEGNIKKIVAIDSDITALKEADEEIRRKNTDITDSLLYAKIIQEAILPFEQNIKDFVKDSFILYLPKDIVSGDFYWFSIKEDKITIAAADCTGHGVPGALMSMLGVSFLNKIINEKGITDTSEILNRLRKNVINSLNQPGKEIETSDGMDISVITINRNNELDYSGAMNRIYIIRNNEIIELLADKMPIGIYDFIDKPFTKQSLEIKDDDIIYLFSDGFPDQFGGKHNKKLGYSKFKSLLLKISQQPLANQKSILLEEFHNWKGNYEQLDDILVFGIKV